MDEYVAEAVPLIEIVESDSDRLKVNERALKVLRRIEGKVCIVCVCGIYRSGKSSLLNWLLDRRAGFTVGPTVNRCTRGIWMWGQPRTGTLPSGEPCTVVILDTEGIGGVEADSKYDARIFSLAVLLCSTLIYNSMGSIDENAISNLSFVAQLSNHIKLSGSEDSKSESDEDSMQDYHKIFPGFLWVVRDFTLELVDTDGDSISGTQYLNSSLRSVPGFDRQTLERNRIRSMLSSFFPDRKCCTLVRPCSSEEELQQVDLLPIEKLRPDFISGLSELKKAVYGDLRPKVMEGKPLNGLMFAALVEAYVSSINSGGVPTLSTAWESISNQECQNAKSLSFSMYKTSMEENCPISPSAIPYEEEEIRTSHEVSSKNALGSYRARAVGVTSRHTQDQLENDIQEEFLKRIRLNELMSRAFCENVMVDLIQSNIQSDAEYLSDLPLFRSTWSSVCSEYSAAARGPAKLQILADFLRLKLLDSVEGISVGIRERLSKEIMGLQAELREKTEALAAKSAEVCILQQSLSASEAKLSASELSCRDLSARCEQQEGALKAVTEEKRRCERAAEESADMRQRSENRCADLEKHLIEAQHVQRLYDELQITSEKQIARINILTSELAQASDGKKSGCGCTVC